MVKWQWTSSESYEACVDDALLVLGMDGQASGELGGGAFAVLRHRASSLLARRKEEAFEGGFWIDSEGERLQAWIQPVDSKPGLDSDDALRLAASDGFTATLRRKPSRVVLFCDQLAPERLPLLLQGIWLSSYRFDRYKSKPLPALPELLLCGRSDAALLSRSHLEAAEVVLSATDFARDLVNEPGSSLPPAEFVARVEALAKTCGLKTSARRRAQLEKEGFGGIVTVGKGSRHEPALLTVEYCPKDVPASPHLVIVGKGITFDTGGISLKPGDKMWEMKNDMAGAAAACAAVAAIGRLRLPIRVTALACLAENRPGENSVLPGDIFKAKNGKTVMVDNTDAEGRLVLSDGLCEAVSLGATHVVDLATLTGAIVRALGSSIAGLFANQPEWAVRIAEAGRRSGEKFWQMPLEMEYRERLDDPVADLKNIGGAEAGAITAALFLQEFVSGDVAWAHLDIAGTAFVTKPWKYFREGATGFGIPTLVDLARGLSTR
jgi:leucyl aminopeptidase